ncbi:MAG: FxLYD domain-containing protein [bacterium]
MATSERQISGSNDDSRRKLIIIVAVIAAIVIAVVFYFLMRASGGGSVEPTLANAIRTGSPQFKEFQSKIVVDEVEADEAKRALGDIVMSLHGTVRNFSGRTLNGLEITASVVNHQGEPVKQRTVVVIPARQPELEPNRTMPVQVMLEGMTDSDDRANIRMEVTGFTFK